MRVSLDIRDMLVANWGVDAESVARVLALGLEPAEVDGEHLVSAVLFSVAGGRAGRLPMPRYRQLNIRVYTRLDGELAAYFLDVRVTLPGKLAAPFLPVRTTHLRASKGRAEGLGLRLRYGVDGPADPGALGGLELGLFPSAGIRTIRVRRISAEWRRAELLERARVDPLLALGFDVGDPGELLYVAKTSLEFDLPPERLSKV